MGNELFYVGDDGKKRDRELWDELLGDDDLPDDLPTYQEGAEAAEAARAEKQRVDMSARLFECAVKSHDGLLVSLWLSPEVADQLAVPGGEAADQLHITLCYCGKVDDLGETGVLEALEVVREVAGRFGPLSGRIGGAGMFTPSPQSDGRVPIYAVPDVPGLSELRAALAVALEDVGVPPRADHGWSPHITLQYADDASKVPSVPELDLSFDAITVSAGDAKYDIPLASPLVELSDDVPGRFDLPTVSDVRGPIQPIGAMPSKPKRKRKKKPVYWQGLKLSRQPTEFEATVLSLADVPISLSIAAASALTTLETDRFRALTTYNLSDEPQSAASTMVELSDLQARVARYGAFEVDQEVSRQGVTVPPPDFGQIGEAARADLAESAWTAARKMDMDWRSSLARLSVRARRAFRSPEKAREAVLFLASDRTSGGLPSALSELAQEAFGYGRHARMKQIVESRHDYRSKLKTLADDDVDPDLIDYVVHTAIHDANLCERCADVDGKVFEFGSEAQQDHEPPYYLCEGGDRCRCLHILVVGDWRDKIAVREAVGSDRLAVSTEKQAEALIRQRQRLQAVDEDE